MKYLRGQKGGASGAEVVVVDVVDGKCKFRFYLSSKCLQKWRRMLARTIKEMYFWRHLHQQKKERGVSRGRRRHSHRKQSNILDSVAKKAVIFCLLNIDQIL